MEADRRSRRTAPVRMLRYRRSGKRRAGMQIAARTAALMLALVIVLAERRSVVCAPRTPA